jgi:hypothetical protein
MKKFPALHTISAIFRFVSWIVGLLTIEAMTFIVASH